MVVKLLKPRVNKSKIPRFQVRTRTRTMPCRLRTKSHHFQNATLVFRQQKIKQTVNRSSRREQRRDVIM